MTTAIMNGKPQRKQLSEQIDRMEQQLARQDSILDGLSDALNEAVANAAKEGVREAVQGAVMELLTNPELRNALYQVSTQPVEKPSIWQRVKSAARSVVTGVKQTVQAIGSAVATKAAAVGRLVAGAASVVKFAWQTKKPAIIAVAASATVVAVSRTGVARLRTAGALIWGGLKTFAGRIHAWIRGAMAVLVHV